MKYKFKRMSSGFLILTMIISLFSGISFADSIQAETLTVSSVSGTPGETVQVDIALSNNTGLASLMFNLTYDDFLTLTNVSFHNDVIGADSFATATKPFKSPQTISIINATSEITKNGVIATLTFKISEEAPDDYEAPISASYKPGNVFNKELNNITLNVVNGKVSVCSGIPGDIDKSGERDPKVNPNNKDAVLLFRYAAGWKVEVDTGALDVNCDGSVDNKDAVTLFRYVAGWNVEIGRGGIIPTCSHNMTAVKAKPASCTEDGNIAYWSCDKCGKYFSDADGRTSIALSDTIIKAFGHSWNGSCCSVCGLEQMPIVIIGCNVTYDIANGDTYLEKLLSGNKINNPNPERIPTSTTYTLKNLTVGGYRFLGWYDGAGSNAEQVKKIAAGTIDDVELYAHWEKIPYKVQLKSDVFIDTNELTYTVDTGVALPTPKLSNYVFTGWSDEDGHLYNKTKIPAGTTGNIFLNANWTSERNKTWTKTKLDDPIIVEDEENNTILFAYEIGEIQNVPIYTIKDFGYISGDGVTKTETETYSTRIDDGLMSTYTKSASNATTESSNWTLSNSWNEVTSVNEQWCQENGKVVTDAETVAKSNTNNWNISSGRSSSTETANITTNHEGWENQVKIYSSEEKNESDKESHKKTDSKAWNINGKLTYTPKSYSGGIGIKDLSLNGSVGGGFGGEIGGGYEHNWTSETLTEHEESTTNKSGFELSGKQDASKDSTNSTVTNSAWNSSESYGGSNTNSVSKSTSVELSEKISKITGYGSEYAKGEEYSNSQGHASTQSYTDGYSSSVTYTLSTAKEKTSTWTTQATKAGYHRWIVAGTAHIFGVVGYNMSTDSYFVYTYSVMDDETHEFEDYSYTSAEYNDNENGVIPFEIPFDVAKYVSERTSKSNGLKVNMTTGVISEYTGTDTCVVIPEYYNTGNGDVVKVTGISPNAFRGNTKIEAVVLSDFIEEIPDHAFEGCTSLIGVSGGNIKKIGDEAFSGCVSAKECGVDLQVASLGNQAFKGVDTVIANASNMDVAKAVVNSGAKNIILSIDFSNDSENGEIECNGDTLSVPSDTTYFEFNGGKNIYKNLLLLSDAKQTIINKTNLVTSAGIPIQISSPELILNQVTAESTGIGMVLSAENTNLGLQGTINVSSINGDAVLCRNAKLYEINSAVDGKLDVSRKIFVCGNVTGEKYLSYDSCELISADKFNKMLSSHTVNLNANGGTVSETSISVPYGQTYGSVLPIPERKYYTFDGWYTEATGGTEISYDDVVSNDITLYAHWINGWTSWSDSKPPSDYGGKTETRTLYRSRSKLFNTSSSSSLSGWTLYNTTSSWSNYGGWSGWTTDVHYGSDYKQVETRTGYHYYYYVCSNCGRHVNHYGTDDTWSGGCGGTTYENTYTAFKSSKPYSELADWYGTGVYYAYTSEGGLGFAFTSGTYYVPPVTQYRYRTRSLNYTYYYYKWGNWSSWTTTKPSASDSVQVESKTQYRYLDKV